MHTTPEPTTGTVLPLPHLGTGKTGTVLAVRWSESLGPILHVQETGHLGGAFLLYGHDLDQAVEAWTHLPAAA